jgi:ABC-type multidrug transport system permease subunit
LWIVCIVAVFVVLLLLAWVEQISPQAVTPVVNAGGGYFLGFLLFSGLDFLSEIAQFFKTTRSRSEYTELIASLNTCEYGERVALLRSLSVALSRKVPGRSLLASLSLSSVLLLVAAALIGLVIVLSRLLPMPDSSLFLVPVAIGAFLSGFFVPREFQRRGPASIRK